MESPVAAIAQNFNIDGKFLSFSPITRGHINKTFLGVWETRGKEQKFIIQRINNDVFKDVPSLMKNVVGVTQHIARKLAKLSGASDKTLNYVQAKSGEYFFFDQQHGYWRAYHYIDNTKSFDICTSPELAHEAGRTLGRFENYVSDLDAKLFTTPIARFQDSCFRYETLEQAIKNDVRGRVIEVRKEIDFALNRKEDVCAISRQVENGSLPRRVTHGDPKINNILFDLTTNKGVSIVDLDTCMPGSILFDFGDLARSTALTSLEDEPDLNKVKFSRILFEAALRGFMQETYAILSQFELQALAKAPHSVIVTLGVRFLSDYINGDTYFHIRRPLQNLDRARVQFKVAEGMEQEFERMQKLVREAFTTCQKIE